MSFLPTDHTNPAFREMLVAIGDLVTDMAARCHRALGDACESLKSTDAALAKSVAKRDGAINDLEKEITLSVATAIARHNPVAHDLHALMGSVKLAQEFERMADHSKNIARRTRWLARYGKEVAFKEDMHALGARVLAMLDEFLAAEKSADMAKVAEIWRMDDRVNKTYMGIMERALAGENKDDPRALINTIFIAKNFERIGDKIKNLVEIVSYQQTGEIVDFDADDEDDSEEG